jgi:ABC-2 type transport system ATP-binding protein
MDEAERCHEIAYIAYGELLAQGTVAQVIADAHLATYTVSGGDVARLGDELAHRDGVTMVAPFGASLHVSGRDEAALEAAIAPYRADPALHWEKSEASLEDVFIELMGRAQDSRLDSRQGNRRDKSQ